MLNEGDAALGYVRVPPTATLAADGEYTQTLRVALPETTAGNRYLLFVADGSNQQGETNESNNTLARPITLNAPDLVMTEVTAPGLAVLSENIEVTWKVRNQGAVNAENLWYDAVYVSQDGVWDNGDTQLRSFLDATGHSRRRQCDLYHDQEHHPAVLRHG